MGDVFILHLQRHEGRVTPGAGGATALAATADAIYRRAVAAEAGAAAAAAETVGRGNEMSIDI